MSAFPPPPSFYKLYGDAAATDPGHAPPPPPPEPVEGTYEMFGVLHTTEDGVPPLEVQQLYKQEGESIDFKAELLRLNKEAVFNYIDMIGSLADAPSAAQRKVEDIHVILRNMHHLLNLVRPHQARATLQHMLELQLQKKRDAVSEIEAAVERSRKQVEDAAQRLQAVGGAESTDVDGVEPPPEPMQEDK